MKAKAIDFFDGLNVDLIHIAQSFAKDNSNPQIEPAHLFRALLHKSAGLVKYIEDTLDEDYYYLLDWCEVRIQQCDKSPYHMKEVEFSRDSLSVIKEAVSLEEKYNAGNRKLELLLASLVSPGVGFSSEQLKTMPLKKEKVLSNISNDGSTAAGNTQRPVTNIVSDGGVSND